MTKRLRRELIPVSFTVWQKWMELYQHGDIKDISTCSGYSEPTIRRAFKRKDAQLNVQWAITNFYVHKASKKSALQKENEEKQLEVLNQNL